MLRVYFEYIWGLRINYNIQVDQMYMLRGDPDWSNPHKHKTLFAHFLKEMVVLKKSENVLSVNIVTM